MRITYLLLLKLASISETNGRVTDRTATPPHDASLVRWRDLYEGSGR